MKTGVLESIESFDYVVGADGGSSQVRNSLNIDFSGEINEELFFVNDVEIAERLFQKNDVHTFLKIEISSSPSQFDIRKSLD